ADSTISLWDFGVDVDATPPAADDVIEFDENNPDAALGLLNPDWNDIGGEGQPMWATSDSEGNTTYNAMRVPEDLPNVGTGTWESVSWALRTGTDDKGRACLSFYEVPDDLPAICIPAPDHSRPIDLMDYSEDEGGHSHLVGMTAPDVSSLALVAADGTELAP